MISSTCDLRCISFFQLIVINISSQPPEESFSTDEIMIVVAWLTPHPHPHPQDPTTGQIVANPVKWVEMKENMEIVWNNFDIF